MNNTIRNALVLAGVIFITACAGQVTSEVTRFHRDAQPLGETIAVVARDEAKAGSLEFAAYADLVVKKLTTIGYKVVAADDNPQLLVKMDYAVGAGQSKIVSWPRNYVHYRFYYGRYAPLYFGHYWDEPEIYAYTVYPRSLDVSIARANGESLFEGHVKSIGQEQNINEVMPYLVEAMFQNFPGESGVTKVVTIEKDGATEPY